MKRFQKMIGLAAAIGILSISGAVYADILKTPASLAAELTGKTVTEVTEARLEGKTYGTQAKDAGQLEEFQNQMIEIKADLLEQRVKDGVMTQERADEILAAIKANQANCDGTGSAQIGRKLGAGFGGGMGQGAGMGQGMGLRDGSHGGMGFGRNVTE